MPAEIEQEQQTQDEVKDEELDTDFDSGFDDKPTETPAAVEEEEVVTQPAEEEKVEPPKVRQVTEDEWAEVTAKAKELDEVRSEQRKTADKVFGKIGDVERVLKDLQSKTPQGLTVDVTDDIVADLKAEFPEIGEGVLKALRNFAGKVPGTAAVATVDAEAVTRAVVAETHRLQAEALSEEFPEWKQITAPGDTEYRKWLTTQPPEYQERLNTTGSATVVARSIRQFQEAAAVAAKAKAETDAKAKASDEAASKRKARLAEAVTERGQGGHAPGKTEDDEFNEGFNA